MKFTIGELSKEFDITLRTLRFYEDKGLLQPERKGSSRIYNRRDRARLKLVLMGRRFGFPIREIKKILDLYDQKNGRNIQLHFSLKRFNEQVSFLEKQKQDITNGIIELSQMIKVIENKLINQEECTEAAQ